MPLDCQRCGNCCPKDCEYFQREEDGLATCTIQADKEEYVGYCGISPNALLTRGYACSASIQRAREIHPELDVQTYDCGRGVIAIDRSRIPEWVFQQILDER